MAITRPKKTTQALKPTFLKMSTNLGCVSIFGRPIWGPHHLIFRDAKQPQLPVALFGVLVAWCFWKSGLGCFKLSTQKWSHLKLVDNVVLHFEVMCRLLSYRLIQSPLKSMEAFLLTSNGFGSGLWTIANVESIWRF